MAVTDVELPPPTVPTAYVDAIAIIDAALVDIGGRSLVSTDEMADVLLDLRAKFSAN